MSLVALDLPHSVEKPSGVCDHPEPHGVFQPAPATNRADVHRTCSVNVEPQPQPTGVPQQPSATTFSRPAPPFSTVVNNYPQECNQWYLKWLDVQSAVVIPVELPKPTDYVAIYRIADAELSKLRQRATWSDTQLCLHLSPGTPAMAAVWVLLGKTRYPAKFLETYAGKSWGTDIPFDLTIDVLPELLRDPDSHLQHLAAEGPQDVAGFEDIVGESRVIRDAVGRAKRAALRGVSILLLGESGTGKEMFAHAIHKASPRRDRPFVPINCAALSKTLLESELFGHVKGAFTGADRDRQGAFELTNGGTLFLDEVGECDLETQAKLLRVLQSPSGTGSSSRTIRRVGDHREIPVDVRVIAATNRDLHEAISAGTFRDDLFYRLAVLSLTLPPPSSRLREKGEPSCIDATSAKRSRT